MNQASSFTFTTPLDVNIVEMKDGEHLFVEGDISTNDIDLVNDIMTKHCQESMQRQILQKNLKLDIEHEAFRGNTAEEKEINKTRIPAGKLTDATVKDLGNNRYSTRVKGEINRHSPRYNEIKGNLVEKYLDAFSVAFLPTDVSYEKRGEKSVRMLNDVILLNVAMTGNPCNTKAQMVEVFTKSMDAVEEYKKLKELDPSIESQLVVKDNKGGPGSGPRKGQGSGGGSKQSKKEKLEDLRGELDRAIETGDKRKAEKIKNKIKELENSEDIEIKIKDKSHSSEKSGKLTKLKKKSKMKTEMKDESVVEGEIETTEEAESEEAETESEMKSMELKYDAIVKEHAELKDMVAEMSKDIAKIVKALNQPVHKSMGIQKDDAGIKATSEMKSVDPLKLC